MPTTKLILPKGTKIAGPNTERFFTLLEDALWTGTVLIGGKVLWDGRETTASGSWSTYELPDYPWRLLDSNGKYTLWECMEAGEYYQSISLGPHEPIVTSTTKGWRAELGEHGYKVNGATSPDYVRRVTVDSLRDQFIADVASARAAFRPPVPTTAPAPTPTPKWPTRSDRVAVLAAELQTPLADRLIRVKR